MAPSVPLVEIARDAHPDGVGRPDREEYAFDSAHRHLVGAELFVLVVMLPLGDQVKVVIGKDRQEGIGIDEHPGCARCVCLFQPVAEHLRLTAYDRLEEAVLVELLHGVFRTRCGLDKCGLGRLRQEGAHRDALLAAPFYDMAAQYPERVLAGGVNNFLYLFF